MQADIKKKKKAEQNTTTTDDNVDGYGDSHSDDDDIC